jgi:hypothetical protein
MSCTSSTSSRFSRAPLIALERGFAISSVVGDALLDLLADRLGDDWRARRAQLRTPTSSA